MGKTMHDPAIRTEAVARYRAGETQQAIANDLGVAVSSVSSWNTHQAVGVGATMAAAPAERKTELARQAGDIVGLGMAIIRAHLLHYAAQMDEGKYLRPNQLRDLSITVGISRDIHFDYTEGRKGTEVVVDARQQSVLAGLSVEGCERSSLRVRRRGRGWTARPGRGLLLILMGRRAVQRHEQHVPLIDRGKGVERRDWRIRTVDPIDLTDRRDLPTAMRRRLSHRWELGPRQAPGRCLGGIPHLVLPTRGKPR